MNKRTANKGRMVLYDPKEYERRVNDIVEGQMLLTSAMRHPVRACAC